MFFPPPSPPLLFHLKGIINNAWSNINALTAKLTANSVQARLSLSLKKKSFKKMHAKIKVSGNSQGSNPISPCSNHNGKKKKNPSWLFEESAWKRQDTKSQVVGGGTGGLNRGEIHTRTNKHPVHRSDGWERICHNIALQTAERMADYPLLVSNDNWRSETVNLQWKNITPEVWAGHFPMVWQSGMWEASPPLVI